MIRTYKFTCPHCGFTNECRMENDVEREVLFCNVDEGGCDEMVAVEARAEVVIRVTTYKLEKSYWQNKQ